MSKATVRSDLDKLVPMVDQEMLDSMLENLPEEADSEGDAEEQAGVCVHDLYGEVVRVRLCLSQGEVCGSPLRLSKLPPPPTVCCTDRTACRL